MMRPARRGGGRARRRERGWLGLLGAAALLIVTGIVGLPLSSPAAGAATRSYTTDVKRVFFGTDETGAVVQTPAEPGHPDGYHVTLTVSDTDNLRGNQPISVTWTGAHPTGGIVQNPSYGAEGSQMEYPFVLMECRGTAATITPSTCWTQTARERVQRTGAADDPAWRADGRADAADRVAQVGLPSAPRPRTCRTVANERWVPMKAASGTTYYGGGVGCYNAAPEASDQASSSIPDNTTYGITGADGRGSAQFAVWSADENATLGCSAKVACALVAIPIGGIDCDPSFTQADPVAAGVDPSDFAGYQAECEQKDVYAAGEPSDNNGTNFNVATSGRLWWSASNWDRRIVVPLTFAVSGSICSLVNPTPPLLAYGSILMTDIAAQWQPTFCTDKAYRPFLHVQSTDTQARTMVDSGTIKLGFSSVPPDDGFAAPVAQAPVAVTGFAIAYTIDGPDGLPYRDLRLNARLLAKLLSQSYTGSGGVEDTAISGNPATVVADPEFHALNPDLPRSLLQVVNAASAMISLSSDSDMLWSLSSYIAADPDATRWLQGVPDPWGMRVNRHYQLGLPAHQNAAEAHFTLPTSSWPLLDPFELPNTASAPCLKGQPYLAQVAHPVSQISVIEQDLEFGVSNSQTKCPEVTDPNDPSQFVAKIEGLQTPGHRFAIGVVPLTALSRYGLRAAALQTSSAIGPQDVFTDGSGKTFAAPDAGGMRAAVELLAPDPSAGTWRVDYARLAETTDAYPGLMPVYADAPTSGLSESDAARVAQLLSFAAGAGQAPGTANGQLPPGALPMTAANGLGAQVAYTRCAVELVRAQTGTVPPLSGACPVPARTKPAKTPKPSPTVPVASTPATPSGGEAAAPPPAAASPSVAPPTAASVADVPVASAQLRTVGAHSAFGRYGLAATLLVGCVLAIVALLLRWGGDLWALTRLVRRRR
jgi:hypothetical protein